MIELICRFLWGLLRSIFMFARRLCMFAPKCPRVPASRCFYARLGLFPGATLWQTRDAYEAARRAGLHPAAQRLVDEAYAALSDPVRRELYLLVRRGLVASGASADPLDLPPDRSLLQVARELVRRVLWRLRR